jgi:hypothetical protein
MRNVQDTLLDAVDAAEATQTSEWIDVRQIFAGSIHVVAAGTDPVGSVKVQVSNDNVTPPQLPTNAVDLGSATVAVSAAGQFLIPRLELSYGWLRVVYTKTSGTGTITAKLNAQGF